MVERLTSSGAGRAPEARPAPRPARTPPVPGQPGPVPAQAIALQRAVGNRVAARVLARWAAHPDQTKKGVMVPDSVAAEYVHFNPPLSN